MTSKRCLGPVCVTNNPSPRCHPDPAVAEEGRSEEHTSELQSQSNLVCRLLLEKKKQEHLFSCVRCGERGEIITKSQRLSPMFFLDVQLAVLGCVAVCRNVAWKPPHLSFTTTYD